MPPVKNALKQYFQQAVNEKALDQVKCPNPDCKSTTIARADIRKISSDLKKKLDDIALHNLLDTSDGAKQCPTPNCNVRFTNEDRVTDVITCGGCKATYCSNCLVIHPHVTCQEHAAGQRAAEDSRTLKMKMETTKPCPTCNIPIAKIDGCLAVKCPNGICLP